MGLRTLVFAILATTALSACHIEPWVKPYERETLADPLMLPSRDPLLDKYRQHVYDTREGARGAGVSHGGGCGCN